MKRNQILPLIAIVSVLITIGVIIDENRAAPKQPLVLEPAQSPYASFIAGTGLVETHTGNISVATPVAGVVKEIDVKVGDHVKAGDVLFKVDDRDLQGRLITAIARVKEAQASLDKPKHRLAYTENLRKRDPSAISKWNLSDLRDVKARAEASLKLAQAQVKQVQIEISRRTVRAPEAGQVLQLHLHKGEYVAGSRVSAPVMLFGDTNELYVRVEIDEDEIWRLQRGADAVAFVRGIPGQPIPLRFGYIEPKVIPKTSMTGRSTERTDTRVLQVIYKIKRGQLPIYVG